MNATAEVPGQHDHLLAFVAVTMFIVIRASRTNRTASDYYTGGRSSPAARTASAPSPGDYLSLPASWESPAPSP